MMGLPVIILGGGGHARVLIESLRLTSVPIVGIADSDPDLHGKCVDGIAVIGDDDCVRQYAVDEVLLVNGVGSVSVPAVRIRLFERYAGSGYHFATVVHPAALIAQGVRIGEGAQIMAGAIIQPGCCIGLNAIVNTGAVVDHDCFIGDHAHIAPGVTLSGGVRVGDKAHVGTGATVIQGIGIGTGSVVGAGAVVVRDIPAGVTAFGIPAKVTSP